MNFLYFEYTASPNADLETVRIGLIPASGSQALFLLAESSSWRGARIIVPILYFDFGIGRRGGFGTDS